MKKQVALVVAFLAAVTISAAETSVCDRGTAKRLFEMGADTVLTNDYLPVSLATGVK